MAKGIPFMKHSLKIAIIIIFGFCICAFGFSEKAHAFSRGIYLTQETLQNNKKLDYLIQQSKIYGIDTFVIDMNYPNKKYEQNIAKVKQSGITYIARVVIFPHGGTHAQITNPQIWAKRLALANAAIKLGASAIQLDYIRYEAQFPGSLEKTKQILKVVQYFRSNVEKQGVQLQMDVFGIVAHSDGSTIGQNIQVLASAVNAFCPMVYPSHYEPFRWHSVRPYETVFNSVTALKNKLQNAPNTKVFAYIEAYNYRFFLSPTKRTEYIRAEMKAAEDAGANGFYVWSARNMYDPLFRAMKKV